MDQPELTNNIVNLRPVRLDDADRIYELLRDSPEIARWTRVPWPYEREMADEFLRTVTGSAPRADFAFAICENGPMLGIVGIHGIGTSPGPRSSKLANEVGYWLHRSARGRGLASEAARLVTDWALGPLGLRVARLQVIDGNDASRRVAERAGYESLGVVDSADLDSTDDPCSRHLSHRYERRAP